MVKKSKFKYIISSIVIGVTSLLIVLFSLLATGVIGHGGGATNHLVINTYSSSKTYDGTPLSDNGYKLAQGSLLNDDRLVLEFPNTLTDVGKIDNIAVAKVFDSHNNDVSSKYNFTYNVGYLQVFERPIEITSDNAKKVYDGEPLVKESYSITDGSLCENHTINATFITKVTNASTKKNDFNVKIFDAESNDVTKNYSIKKVLGELEVIKKPLSLLSSVAIKNYDGTPIENLSASIISGSILEGHKIEYDFTQNAVNAGTYKNSFYASVVDDQGNNVTSNYNITLDYGNYLIMRKNIEFTSSDQSKIYDGTPITTSDVELISGELLKGHTYEVKNLANLSIPGQVDAGFDIYVTDENGVDVTSNYNVIKNQGVLKVDPIEIQIKTGSEKKVYDGKPLSNKDAELIKGELIKGHTIEFKTVNEITNVGTIDNKVTCIFKDKEGNDVSSFYKVDTTFVGKLEIVPLKIDIATIGAKKEYDGKPLVNNEYKYLSSKKVLEGHTLEVIITGRQLEVGISKNTLQDYMVYDENGVDITFNYEISADEGDLIVTEKDFYNKDELDKVMFNIYADQEAHIYLKNFSYGLYDGKSWKQISDETKLYLNLNHDINPQFFLAEQLKEIGLTPFRAKITEVAPIPYLYPFYQGNFDSTNQRYDFTIFNDFNKYYYCDVLDFDYKSDSALLSNVPESLKAVEEAYFKYVKEQYLELPKETKEFMLTYASDNNLTIESESIIMDVANNVKNAARYDLDFKPFPENVDPAIYFLSEAESGVCRHYACSAAALYRALGIPARYVTGYSVNTKANEDVKVTALQAHAWVEVYISGCGWVAVEVTGSSDSGMDGPADFGDNELKVTPYPTRKKYDGTPLQALNKVVGLELLTQYGYTYECSVIGERTEKGITKSKINSLKIFNKAKKDVTKTFKFKKYPGIVQVYGDILDVKTSSSSKIYDGLPLSNNNYEIVNPIEGITVENAKFDKAKTYVGKYLNVVSLKLINNLKEDVTDTIFVRYQYGVLEITPRPITIVTGTKSKQYDGEPLSDHTFTVDNLAKTDKIQLVMKAEIVGIGNCENSITTIKITKNSKEEQSVILNYCYDIEVILGKLEVYY